MKPCRLVLRLVCGILSVMLAVGLGTPALAGTTVEEPSLGQHETGAAKKAKKKKPSIKKVSPRSGPAVGRTPIVIKGREFRRVKAVTIGGEKVRFKVKSARKIKAVTPPGFTGAQAVQVKTKAGKSKVTRKSRFTYKDSPASDVFRMTPAPGTVVATDVEWVTGGTSIDDPQPGAVSPWQVGIGPVGAVPEVGSRYYLAPGSPVFPSGLAGTVTAVSTQAGSTAAATVTPTALDDVLSDYAVSYADPPGGTARTDERASEGGVDFKGLPPSSFLCTDEAAQQGVSFRGSLDLSFENIHKEFAIEKPTLFSRGSLSAWIRMEPVLSGSVTATGSIKCALKPAWVNAHRRVIPIGTSGATISFAPSASFSISGSGTIKFTQRSRRMFGLTYFNGDWDTIDKRVNLGTEVTAGELSFKVEADAGLSAQFGLLDRVGLEAKVTLNAFGKATAKSSPRQTCVDLSLGVKLKILGFLDIWVTRWVTPGYEKVWPFATYSKCTRPASPDPVATNPEITTYRLPAAQNKRAYSAFLTTEDGRPGTWQFATGGYPLGLSLSTDGELSGTPTVMVGDYVFSVVFTDLAGQQDVQSVRLYVGPEPTVGGGDIQVSLIWGTFVDQDLYVTDPSGETIYYGHRNAASGGYLDRDANAGCGEQVSSPIENVFWPTGTAPSGRYLVASRVWSECGQSDLSWRLVIRVGGGVVLDETGTGDSPTYYVDVANGRVSIRPGVPSQLPAPLKG